MIKTTYKPSQVILTVLSAAFFMCVGWIIYANKDNDGDNGKYGWLCFWMNSLGIYLLLLIRNSARW